MKRNAFFIFLLFICLSAAFAQKKEMPLGLDGKPVEINKDWFLVDLFVNKEDKITLIYTYQVESVVKTAPNTFKFWVKSKNYKDADLKYTLISYEVKCKMREIRTNKIIEYKTKGGSEAVENPNKSFEDIVPDSLDEKVYSTICTKYDK